MRNNKDLDIDLNHLVIFNKIAESKNLTQAALVLGVEKTRLSRILSDLEKRLGVELIYRTTRQFHLTEAGHSLYQKTNQQIRTLQTVTRDLRSHEGIPEGHIKITGAHGFFSRVVPSIISDFNKIYPNVSFEIVLAQQSLDLVKEGIDLAVRMGTPKDSSLKMRVLAGFSLIFAASSEYISKYGAPSNFDELGDHKIVMLESMNSKKIELSNSDKKQNFSCDGFFVSNAPDLLTEFVREGLGIGLLPEMFYRDYFKTRELIHLFPGWQTSKIPVCLISPYKGKQPNHIKVFSDYLADRLKDL